MALRLFWAFLLPCASMRLENDIMNEGTECTARERTLLWQRLGIGKAFGKPCSLESEWGSSMVYNNPASPNTVALFLYPEEDHNGAFNICDERKFDRVLCTRLFTQTEHYSLQFHRVPSVEGATRVVDGIPSDVTIKHLVLAGHGDPNSLMWGSDGPGITGSLSVEDDTTDGFLDKVYRHMIKGGDHRSTVMLDACLNGQPVDDKNMLQHVAHRLAGTRVFASTISWGNDQFFLVNGKEFTAKIKSKGKNQMRTLSLDDPELQKWNFYPNEYCSDKSPSPTIDQSLTTCREACERAGILCNAFVFYPDGNARAPHKKCYLSPQCEESDDSRLGSMIFEKSDEHTY
mmetsp:Transcript_78872/g.189320  ORF Transcript_78872/g.189320 Transcript_78872/m.189320 type:complete len:345 (+) Transcript_78872:72-1106(+)